MGHRIRTGLAVVGGCVVVGIVVPPLAGVINAVGSLTLLGLAGYALVRGWLWMDRLVAASRRTTPIRRPPAPGREVEPRTRSVDRADARARGGPGPQAPGGAAERERPFRPRPGPRPAAPGLSRRVRAER